MRILSIIRNIFNNNHSKPIPLGRWKIETCNIKLNNKIDLSNEDHCGPCGQYIINKNPINLFKNKKFKIRLLNSKKNK
jgi:hypothetical protein